MNDPNIRRFYLRFVYGLLTADFITIIQVISAPQFQIKWTSGISISAACGIFGMILIMVNIPMSVAYAFYSEIVLQDQRPPPRQYAAILGGLFGMGATGLAFIFASFRPAFGIAFSASLLISGIAVVVIGLRRPKRIRPKSN